MHSGDKLYWMHLATCADCTRQHCPVAEILHVLGKQGAPFHWYLEPEAAIEAPRDGGEVEWHETTLTQSTLSSEIRKQAEAGFIRVTSAPATQDMPRAFLVRKYAWKFSSDVGMQRRSVPNAKPRLVVDFSGMRAHAAPLRFGLDGPAEFAAQLEPGSWIYSWDVAKAFYAFKAHPASWNFTWFNANGLAAHFFRMPMGMVHSPIHLQTATESLADIIRARRFLQSVYMDDYAGGERHAVTAWAGMLTSILTARQAGFNMSIGKLTLPSQSMRFLGMDITTTPTVDVRAPPERQLDLAATLKATLKASRLGLHIPVNLLEHLQGKAIAYAGSSKGQMARSAALVVVANAAKKNNSNALKRPEIARAVHAL